MLKPGVILTLDVSLGNSETIGSWFDRRQYFIDEGIKCVFFVGGWARLSDNSKDRLRALVRDGHEIGLHTETHTSATQASNLDKYISSEITAPEAGMLRDGFKQPVSFAYANCQTNGAINDHFNKSIALDKIKFVRACTGDNAHIDPDKLTNNKVYGSVWLDNLSQNGNRPYINYTLSRAVQTGTVLVLAGHGIFVGDMTNTPIWNVNFDDLKVVVKEIKSKLLAFYTYSDMLKVEEPEDKKYNEIIFDEEFFLGAWPDIEWAVELGFVESGKDFYDKFRDKEPHRKSHVRFFDETYYLETHSDVRWAVENKYMTTGYDHFKMFGKKEGRDHRYINPT